MDSVELQAKFEAAAQANDRQQRIIQEIDKQSTKSEDVRKESIKKEEIYKESVNQQIQQQSSPVTYNNSGTVNRTQQSLFSMIA